MFKNSFIVSNKVVTSQVEHHPIFRLVNIVIATKVNTVTTKRPLVKFV